MPREIQFAVMQLDYQATQDLIKLLTDIRFRLLGFVPTFSTIGVTLVSAQIFGAPTPLAMITIGLMGFFLTLGLILYDLRNSGLYDGLIHRAKILEGVMGCVGYGNETIAPAAPTVIVQSAGAPLALPSPPPLQKAKAGGAHTQRAPSYYRFILFPVKHDLALALVYGVALGAWLFPIAKGLSILFGDLLLWCELLSRHSNATGATTTLAAVVVAFIGTLSFYRALSTADNPSAANELTDPKDDQSNLINIREDNGQGSTDQWTNNFKTKAQRKMYENIAKRYWPSRWIAWILLRQVEWKNWRSLTRS